MERDSEGKNLVMHAMRLRRDHGLVRAQPARDVLVAALHRLEVVHRLLARHRVSEKELEQHLVADLEALDRRVGHPSMQRLLAERGEVVPPALPRYPLGVLGLY